MSALLRYRQLIVSTHVLTAGFFLPAAIMFAITGSLYTFGNKGEYKTQKIEVPLTIVGEPLLSDITEAAKKILTEHNKGELPTGQPALKKAGTSWQFEWTGSRFDFTIDPKAEAGMFVVAIKSTTAHRFFVQLHKAKGGLAFKILAAGLAVGLITLFLGGVLLAFASPKLKQQLYVSLALGTAAFIAAAILS